ncbi:MAG: hypothetical protein ACRD3J_06000 [Thermoanaerobaculia bacterium]
MGPIDWRSVDGYASVVAELIDEIVSRAILSAGREPVKRSNGLASGTVVMGGNRCFGCRERGRVGR